MKNEIVFVFVIIIYILSTLCVAYIQIKFLAIELHNISETKLNKRNMNLPNTIKSCGKAQRIIEIIKQCFLLRN